jgi:hypothetical protein
VQYITKLSAAKPERQNKSHGATVKSRKILHKYISWEVTVNIFKQINNQLLRYRNQVSSFEQAGDPNKTKIITDLLENINS